MSTKHDPNADTPIAQECKQHGCHYAGFLQQSSGLTNAMAEVKRLRAKIDTLLVAIATAKTELEDNDLPGAHAVLSVALGGDEISRWGCTWGKETK